MVVSTAGVAKEAVAAGPPDRPPPDWTRQQTTCAANKGIETAALQLKSKGRAAGPHIAQGAIGRRTSTLPVPNSVPQTKSNDAVFLKYTKTDTAFVAPLSWFGGVSFGSGTQPPLASDP